VSRLEGAASIEGTQRFRDRAIRDRHLPREHFRLGEGGLHLSSLGLGTYIGPPDAPTDVAVEHAVTICLTSGRVNVLDTAINYRYQRAERSIGRALARTIGAGTVGRDEVFLATKNGYLAPDSEAGLRPDAWIQKELLATGILRPEDVVDGSHSMSPTYLNDQFERSRKNLGVDSIDLLYLHNAPDAQLPAVGREEFLERLGAAFELLERFRDQGRLGAYGIATWECLRAPPDDPGFFDLESAVRIARDVGGEKHGFRYVQFPFNLGMPEAATFRNQPVGDSVATVFDAARRLGVHCFTSVPLFQGQLARSGPKHPGFTTAQTALQFARSAPGSLGPLVGQKSTEHLSENLELASRPPWGEAIFREFLN
jgi:aryl-alcohol dehydrogenase-like predicted oxidoreductase